MNFKSLMLGAAAATLAATGAQAADLPVAPEPVDYVRICDAYGVGYYYIPGTETCLRIGGGVRADYRFQDFAGTGANNWDDKSDTSTSFRARAYVNMDSRTQTEYGLLRTKTNLWFTDDTSDAAISSLFVWEAFIQFAGFTFGKTGSFFDHWTGENWGAQIGQGLDERAIVLAYTAAFGNGLSASLSLESDDGARASAFAGTGGVGTYARGGEKFPVLVASLLVNQGWGSAQLAGLIRQNHASTAGVDSETGWAVMGDVSFNVPMLGAKDTFALRASYSDGAVQYVDTRLTTDATLNAAGTGLSNSTAWGVAAGFTHYWTPAISTALTGVYSSQDALGTANDIDQWSVNGQIAWSPISGFVTGVEVEYLNQDFGAGGTDDDDLVATFRVQRTF